MSDAAGRWDAPSWRERDLAWAAGCRWLQSWWRETHLHLPPGERTQQPGARLVASMLPVGRAGTANFLSPEVAAAVEARLAEGPHSGIIDIDRLYRNLLSSQPVCFNLFGPFHGDPAPLLPWVRSIDPAATSVDAIRFEWAPPKKLHFHGGSAFDALIEYSTARELCFLGVECKYAENLAASRITVRQAYIDFTTEEHGWRDGAAARLDTPALRQFWLNTLLGQSLAEKEERFERGTVVVAACARDRAAFTATSLVRAELHQPDAWLQWSPYETILDIVGGDGPSGWQEAFRRRYLDFSPVAHLLSPGDARLTLDNPIR